MFKTLVHKLSQPSSYAGLAAIAISAGVTLPAAFGPASVAAAGIFGLIAFLLDEKGDKQPPA